MPAKQSPQTPAPPLRLDALLPSEVARRAEDVGVRKAAMGAVNTLTLGVLAGAFIALGAVFFTVVTTTAGAALPWGVTRMLGGLAFSLGLILVVVAGAELFTGNNLIVMAWAAGKLSAARVLRNWALVYVGNAAGAAGTAVLVWLSGHPTFAGGAVGLNALAIASRKVELGFTEALLLGVLCNALVCLAVWLTLAAHTVTDKILAILLPIAAFVAAGFEHSIANLYFVPMALLIQGDAGMLAAATGSGGVLPAMGHLTWSGFLLRNLLPVTLGNIIGGGGLVGLVYWFVYLRGER